MAQTSRNRCQRTASDMPLVLCLGGQELELVRVQGGRGLALRLATMGLIPGSRFRVESGGKTGPVLISFGGARLILGHGMAQRMMVRVACEKQ